MQAYLLEFRGTSLFPSLSHLSVLIFIFLVEWNNHFTLTIEAVMIFRMPQYLLHLHTECHYPEISPTVANKYCI
jgi:hypothetical protein